MNEKLCHPIPAVGTVSMLTAERVTVVPATAAAAVLSNSLTEIVPVGFAVRLEKYKPIASIVIAPGVNAADEAKLVLVV